MGKKEGKWSVEGMGRERNSEGKEKELKYMSAGKGKVKESREINYVEG